LASERSATRSASQVLMVDRNTGSPDRAWRACGGGGGVGWGVAGEGEMVEC
jgi:hypothetical protein